MLLATRMPSGELSITAFSRRLEKASFSRTSPCSCIPPIRSVAALALRSVESFTINWNPAGVTVRALYDKLCFRAEKSEIVPIVISEATRLIVPELYLVFPRGSDTWLVSDELDGKLKTVPGGDVLYNNQTAKRPADLLLCKV